MNYCTECGNEIEGKINFCPECGNKISTKENRGEHSQGEDKSGGKEAKAKEKIENLLRRAESSKKSGEFPFDNKKVERLRNFLKRAIEAYEFGDYERSLEAGRKTENYLALLDSYFS